MKMWRINTSTDFKGGGSKFELFDILQSLFSFIFIRF